MAMVKCKECREKISSKAAACPKCGVARRGGKGGRAGGCLIMLICLVVAFVWIGGKVGGLDSGGTPPVPKTRAEMVERQFRLLNGSHREFVRIIKGRMNDPKSFEHAHTSYSDNGETIYVEMTFRGKNAFGGVVTQFATAHFDIDGNLVELGSIE